MREPGLFSSTKWVGIWLSLALESDRASVPGVVVLLREMLEATLVNALWRSDERPGLLLSFNGYAENVGGDLT